MVQATPTLKLLAVSSIPGYVRGLSQPALRLHLQLNDVGFLHDPAPALERLRALPDCCLAGKRPRGRWPDVANPVWQLAEGLIRLQITAGLVVNDGPVLEAVQLAQDRSTPAQALVLIPGPTPGGLSSSVNRFVHCLNGFMMGLHDPLDELQNCVQRLARWAPPGNNNRHILREAAALKMPVIPLPGNVYQIGWGHRSRLFKSTITDSTPAIATAWAKDKRATNAMLRMAGLPVPEQRSVSSIDEAIQVATQMGYPVVLKPYHLDQGIGVEADLRTESNLRSAFGRASQHGRTLILERHITGEDYRVYVVRGELVGVAHRVPATVVGDGVSSVAQLVDQVNQTRLAAPGGTSVYKPIELDEEACELIAREGLSVTSRLPNGMRLRLRRSANSSRGGTSADVTHLAHPDNIKLCIQAASLLRLDIAGLDFLTPDISRSWREVGGGFCEVNAQPQMGGAHPWIFERILRSYLRGTGRIPAALILGHSKRVPLGPMMAQSIGQSFGRAEAVIGEGLELSQRTTACIMQPELGGVVVETGEEDLLRWGLPLDRFDLLIVDDWSASQGIRQQTWAWLCHHIKGPILFMKTETPERDRVDIETLTRYSRSQRPEVIQDRQTLLSRLQDSSWFSWHEA